eukprot:gene26254-34344_t
MSSSSSSTILSYMEEQRIANPDLAAEYEELATLYDKKLWHQLSNALEKFLSSPMNNRGNNFVELYSNFIVSVEARFNQVKLATLISLIGNSVTDTSIALDLYQKVLLSRERLGREAALCLDMEIAIIYMKIGKLDLAKSSLEAAKEQIPSINSTEAVAFSKFYMATAEYRKASPPQEFYNAALMFLSYTHVDDLSSESKYILATDMALASITGDDIFNFGEVIATPILSVLVGTPNQWLRDLVYALNSGKIDDFNLIVGANKESYSQQPALANRHEIVKQKVVLLCVLNIAFERSANDRLIPFEEIAATARIPIDQVEWVLMRAMSLGLIKGIIDGVEEVVNVTWVQPRVLDKGQLNLLHDQLGAWTERVKGALITIEKQAIDLFA